MITTPKDVLITLRDELDHVNYRINFHLTTNATMTRFFKNRSRQIKKDIKYYESLYQDQKIVLGSIKTDEEKEIAFGKAKYV